MLPVHPHAPSDSLESVSVPIIPLSNQQWLGECLDCDMTTVGKRWERLDATNIGVSPSNNPDNYRSRDGVGPRIGQKLHNQSFYFYFQTNLSPRGWMVCWRLPRGLSLSLDRAGGLLSRPHPTPMESRGFIYIPSTYRGEIFETPDIRRLKFWGGRKFGH